VLHYQKECTDQRNDELVKELEIICMSMSSQQEGDSSQPETNTIMVLHEQITILKVRVEVQCQLKECTIAKTNKLIEELEGEHFDASLRGGEADFWQEHCKYLQERCKELEEQLVIDQQTIPSLSKDKNMHIRTMTPKINNKDQNDWSDHSLLLVNVGDDDDEPTHGLEEDTDDSYFECFSADVVIHIAAACDDANAPHERKFRSAQCYHNMSRECPQTSGSDRHCMAALVKVNGLEAYALVDLGSTTVSIMHDFAHVAKLNIIQLENPVPLQLDTVGSQSMINYGARTYLELGPISDNNAYLDVVNINRYDMILGTPFMHKHGLVLDFEHDTLNVRREHIPTMTSGQEDLMLAKKQAQQVRAPHTEGQQTCTAQ